MESIYEYKRIDLAIDAIRLVRICRGAPGQRLECELFETYLSKVDGVPYEALSYVWGSRESKEKILVDGCPFTVTENLFEALSNLREYKDDRILWIDAVCIDQSDLAERGHQVGQMRRIYANAQSVIVWLGASTEEIDHLFCWMRYLDDQMLKECQPTITNWKRQWAYLCLRFENEPQSSSVRRGLQDVLGREWFFRIWVIQEAAFAKAARITCGRNNISSRAFSVMPTLLNIRCDENVQSRLEIMPGLLRKTSWWSGPESQDLGILLQKFGKSKAGDERDIIYALLGLSKDAYSSKILRPDYHITVQTAIQRTVVYLLIQSGHSRNRLNPTELPEWSMDEFLSALNDLPSRAHTWIQMMYAHLDALWGLTNEQ